jgi:AraC-like DNA-binding protein
MEHRAVGTAPISVYREFAPSAELRDYVRALAWFGPADEPIGSRTPTREFYIGDDRELTPSFADAHTSLVFSLGVSFARNGWEPSPTSESTVIGAMTRATQPASAERAAMIGVYLRPRGRVALLALPAAELSDRIIALREAWKGFALSPERTSLQTVENLLTQRLHAASRPDPAVRIAELASYVRRCGGRIGVSQMADLIGLSRQHLRRLFLEYIGVTPKLYARLTRFRTALGFIQRGHPMSWSGFAERVGYADQSHLIADFREFSSFTPMQLARGNRFHPFIGDERRPAATAR